jgi:hypothetical protein
MGWEMARDEREPAIFIFECYEISVSAWMI